MIFMSKKKIITIAAVGLCAVLLVAAVFLLQKEDEKNTENNENSAPVTLAQVKKGFASDIQELMDGKYENLIPVEFESSVEDVEAIYNLEIVKDDSNEENSALENLEAMETAIDKFFGEGLDKSFLTVEAYLSESDMITMRYDELEKTAEDGTLDNTLPTVWIYGNDPEDGKYVQIKDGLLHAWFSKNALDEIHPSGLGEFKEIYPYFAGIPQGDTVIQLQDGEIKLKELEQILLDYMNGENFPLIRGEGIHYAIGEARIIEKESYEAVCFKVRRIYKGVPFEYGESSAGGEYIDKLGHDGGEITYVESNSPDTMMGFFRASGTVVEKEEITEMLTAGAALSLLSEQIGETSVYEVRGMELVYRNCELTEEEQSLSDKLAPKWKIITINQNDDKYTLFYVDVVTGEITDRFEYYYD